MASSSAALTSSNFFYSVHGQIRHGDFPLCERVYVKTSYHHGADWKFCHGIEEGLSQLAVRSRDGDQSLVWNFPIQCWWSSSSPHGWPRLILSLYGPDAVGNDTIQGYGSTALPISPGKCSKSIAIYRPQSSSLLQQWTSWFSGRRPELIDPKSIACGQGRDVFRTETRGHIVAEFECTFKDFRSLGYESHHGNS